MAPALFNASLDTPWLSTLKFHSVKLVALVTTGQQSGTLLIQSCCQLSY